MSNDLVTDFRQLAESISKKADEIEAAQKAGNEVDAKAAKADIVSLADDIKLSALGPFWWLFYSVLGYCDNAAFAIASEFDLISHVPDEGISYEDLSKASGCPLDPLIRTVRLLILNRVFVEATPGHVSHSVCSNFLKDPVFSAIVGHCSNEGFPAAAFTKNALRQFPEAQEPKESGFSLAYRENGNMFDYFNSHPKEQERFNTAMIVSNGNDRGLPLKDLYPWQNINKLVDIGGGQGHMTIEIAKAFPSVQVIVEDLKDACATGEKNLPSGLADRFTFQVHDFFATQPIKGADAYYMRHILHDWPDKYCVKILQAIVPAMKPGSKILINESLVAQPGEMKPSDERFVRYKDFQMLVLLNAKERTLDDFKNIIKATDPRLVFRKAWTDPNSQAVEPLIEIEFTG